MIGSGTGPDGVIAPYWDDLRDNGGNDQLRYSIGGTAPNRYFAIDYYSFSWYCGSGYSYIQAVIYESGIIDFNYGYSGGTTWSDPTCASASIGITQPGDGEFYCGANYGSVYNSGSTPQHYRFTPRPPCATNLSPSNGATDLSYNSPTLSWNAVDLADAYDVYIGTLSQLTGSGLPLVSNNQAGTSYSPSGLSASTTYYWQVVPTNNISGDASGCSAQSFTTEAVIPLITTSGSLSAFSSCSGTASSSDSFTVSGADMEAGITVTAPTGYEVSTDNTSFSSSLVVGSSGTISSTTIYVRLANSASGSSLTWWVFDTISPHAQSLRKITGTSGGFTRRIGWKFGLGSPQQVQPAGRETLTSSTQRQVPTLWLILLLCFDHESYRSRSVGGPGGT